MSVKEFCEKYYISRKGTNSLKWDALDARFGDPDIYVGSRYGIQNSSTYY